MTIDTANPAAQAIEGDNLDDVMQIDYAPPAPVAFGHCMVSTRKVVLQKGAPRGRADYNPAVHKPAQMRTEITISIAPLPGSNSQYPTERTFLAESEDWTKVTKASLIAMGKPISAVHDAFVQAELIGMRQYDKKNPDGTPQLNADGSAVKATATAIGFKAIYPDEATCLAAYEERFGGGGGEPAETQAHLPTAAPAVSAQQAGNDAERNTALQFLTPLWNGANGNRDLFLQQVRETPLVAKYFYDKAADTYAPEVTALCGDAPAAAAAS